MEDFSKLIDLGVAGMILGAGLQLVRMFLPRVDQAIAHLSTIATALQGLQVSVAEVKEDIDVIKDDITELRVVHALPERPARPPRPVRRTVKAGA